MKILVKFICSMAVVLLGWRLPSNEMAGVGHREHTA